MRGWPGSVSQISVFPTGISVRGLEILPYEHFSQVTGMNCDGACGARRIACSIFYIKSIPFNSSDTALKVAKVIIFVFCHHFLCFSNFAPELVPRIFCLFSSRIPWLKFLLHCRNQGEIRPGNRAGPVNRPAPVKI